MLLIPIALTLLVIVAGMFLLAHTKKENLGKFFKIVSWFVIIVGFLTFACLTARGIKNRVHNHCCKKECSQEACHKESKSCPMGAKQDSTVKQ